MNYKKLEERIQRDCQINAKVLAVTKDRQSDRKFVLIKRTIQKPLQTLCHIVSSCIINEGEDAGTDLLNVMDSNLQEASRTRGYNMWQVLHAQFPKFITNDMVNFN